MTTADLAGEFGVAARHLAEAIDQLSKCVRAAEVREQMKRIERLRMVRDQAAKAYREAAQAQERRP